MIQTQVRLNWKPKWLKRNPRMLIQIESFEHPSVDKNVAKMPNQIKIHLNANFMSLGWSYLHLLDTQRLPCFPCNSCLALDHLHRRNGGIKH